MVPADEKVNKMARLIIHTEEIVPLGGNTLNEDKLLYQLVRIKPIFHANRIRLHHIHLSRILPIVRNPLEKDNTPRIFTYFPSTFWLH